MGQGINPEDQPCQVSRNDGRFKNSSSIGLGAWLPQFTQSGSMVSYEVCLAPSEKERDRDSLPGRDQEDEDKRQTHTQNRQRSVVPMRHGAWPKIPDKKRGLGSGGDAASHAFLSKFWRPVLELFLGLVSLSRW
jgi:hypothetical protein